MLGCYRTANVERQGIGPGNKEKCLRVMDRSLSSLIHRVILSVKSLVSNREL